MELEGLPAAIAEYIDARKEAKLEDKVNKKLSKALQKAQESEPDSAVFEEIANLKNVAQSIEEEYKYPNWLSNAANRASQISLATHAVKFTHSEAKGSSILASQQDLSSAYLSTASLAKTEFDTVGNAAALDVAGLLQLEVDGQSLAAYIAVDDSSPFNPFAENEQQLQKWLQGFKAALSDSQLSSHSLAKQLYIPVPSDEAYHLISPLFASALAQQVYERVNESRYSETAKAINKAKREQKAHDGISISYPNVAIQEFGGSKPQNISKLNSGRGGKSYCFSCAPPKWRSQRRPPLNKKTLFDTELNRITYAQTQELRNFLLAIAKRDSTLELRQHYAHLLQNIIDRLLNYVAEIQNLSAEAGWSADESCTLKQHEKLWLDPYRQDPEFQSERSLKHWQEDIATDFARWLKQRLRHKQLLLGLSEHQNWQKFFARQLRIFEQGLGV